MYRLGIDLGGTNIVAGVVDENYEIIAKASCKTNVPRPESEICDSMADVALKAIEKAKLTIDDIESIGIGVPGAVNPKTGVIEYSANLFFHNWQVVKMMEERLNTKICVENDANVAALGEYLAGSAKGAKNAIAITLGTGIGGGIIINGKIYSGSNYAGAELGHMVIVKDGKECACGRKGCWEHMHLQQVLLTSQSRKFSKRTSTSVICSSHVTVILTRLQARLRLMLFLQVTQMPKP